MSRKETVELEAKGWLRIDRPAGKQERIPLTDGQIVRIGRKNDNDLVLEHPKVSRHHVILQCSGGTFLLTDVGSLNGTALNGFRLQSPTYLKHGDCFEVGDAKFWLESARQSMGGDPVDTMSTQLSELQVVDVLILVADISGYTTLSELLPASEVGRMLQEWFGMVTAVVKKHGGEVSKFLGDAALVIWPVASSSGDNERTRAEKALAAAREILKETSILATGPHWPYASIHPWKCKVSLSAGEGVCGTVGGEYTVLGDAVNVAFRLNDLCKEYGLMLLVSQNVASAVGGASGLRFIREVKVEGRQSGVRVYSGD